MPTPVSQIEPFDGNVIIVVSGVPTVTGNVVTYGSGNIIDAPGSFDYSDVATLTITPASFPDTPAEQSVSYQLSTSGGTGNISYLVTAGTLPSGLTLSSTGLLSGIPGQFGDYGTFSYTITAVDEYGYFGWQGYSVDYAHPTMTIVPPILGVGTAGSSYNQALLTTGGVAPYTYTLDGGSLPAGLTLNATGSITGTPTVSGTFSFTVGSTDSYLMYDSKTYSLSVSAPVIDVYPTSIPNPVGETPYSVTFSCSGGAAPYTYAITAGTAPPGLSITGDTLSGTVYTAGTYNFTVTATDSNGFTSSINYQTTIQSPPIVIVPTTLPAMIVDVPYATALNAAGGTPTYTYAVTEGTLPTGLTMNMFGVITGTPTDVGTYSFIITVTDNYGFTKSITYTTSVQPLPYIVIYPTSLEPGAVDREYFVDLHAEGGTLPYVYTLTQGSLAPGLTLAADTGIITGTPTTIGNYPFTVTATDFNGFDGSREYYLVITQEPPVPPVPDSVVHVSVGGRIVPDTDYTITSRNPVIVDFLVAPPSGELVSIWVDRGYSWYAPGVDTPSNGIPLQLQHTPAANFINGK